MIMRAPALLAIAVSASIAASADHNNTPAAMSQADSWQARRAGFRTALRKYPLSNRAMQTGVAELLDKETNDNWAEHAASAQFDSYYDQVRSTCQKIAMKYNVAAAWRALVLSAYNEDSTFGTWLAEQARAIPYIFEMLDMNEVRHGRAVEMLARALNRCYQDSKTPGCATLEPRRAEILRIVRRDLEGNVFVADFAVLALADCGTAEDIPRLEKLKTTWSSRKTGANVDEIMRRNQVEAIDRAISQIRIRTEIPSNTARKKSG